MNTLMGYLSGLINNRENVATGGLCYVLNGSHGASGILQNAVRASGCGLSQIVRYQLQPGGMNGQGRPDMAGIAVDGTVPLLIESKLFAGLTEHQPKSYIERLPLGGVLLFIAPKARAGALEIEIDARLSDQSPARWFGPVGECKVRSRPVQGDRTIAIVSWQELLYQLTAAVLQDQDGRVTAADVHQLCDFIEAACGEDETFLPFPPRLLSGIELPQALSSIRWIVDQVCDQDPDFSPMGKDKQLQFHNYGRNFEFNSIRFWFGYYLPAWRRFGVSPLWLEVSQSYGTELSQVLASFAGGADRVLIVPREQSWYLPVTLAADEPADVALAGVRNELRRFRDSIAHFQYTAANL